MSPHSSCKRLLLGNPRDTQRRRNCRECSNQRDSSIPSPAPHSRALDHSLVGMGGRVQRKGVAASPQNQREIEGGRLPPSTFWIGSGPKSPCGAGGRVPHPQPTGAVGTGPTKPSYPSLVTPSQPFLAGPFRQSHSVRVTAARGLAGPALSNRRPAVGSPRPAQGNALGWE